MKSASLAVFLAVFAVLAVTATAFTASSTSFVVGELDAVQAGQGASTLHQAASASYNLTLVAVEQPVGWSYDSAGAARACLGPLCRVASGPPYYVARVEDCACNGEEFGTGNLTIRINGVETTVMESAWEPFNLTVNTSSLGSRLVVCERGGNFPFAFSQSGRSSGSALVSTAVAEAFLKSDKLASMTVIPTGSNNNLYPNGFNYLVTVELHDARDDLIACKNLTVATDANHYINPPNHSVSVPNTENIRAANDQLINIYSHVKESDGGNESIIIIYSNGTEHGVEAVTPNADGVIAMKVRVLDADTLQPIQNALVWFVERNSYAHWAVPQYSDQQHLVFNRVAGRALTDASGWANVTIIPTGGASFPFQYPYNVTMEVNIPPFTRYVYTFPPGSKYYPSGGYSKQLESYQLPNYPNVAAGRDLLVNMFSIVRCWLNYPYC
ncbi:MAG: hypothetical protein ACP5IG_04285 [Candidatus Micrarchaeia archaeon]